MFSHIDKGLCSCTQWVRSKPCWSRWIDSLWLSRLWIRLRVPITMAKPDLPTGMPLGSLEPTKNLSSQEHFCVHEVKLKLAAGTDTASSHLDWCPCSHKASLPCNNPIGHQDMYVTSALGDASCMELMYAKAGHTQASLGEVFSSNPPSLNHARLKNIFSVWLSAVAISAVSIIPTIAAAKLGTAVLLSGVLSWCPDILKLSCLQTNQWILRPHHQPICCNHG